MSPLRRLRLGGLDAVLAGADPAGGDGPLVVLLHGFGAPGDDLVPLGGVLSAPPGTRFLFPAAPLVLAEAFFGGRAWWMIDWARRERLVAESGFEAVAELVPDGMAEARKAVLGFLDEARAALGVAPERTVLGGFSQGAMLALDVALHDPRPLAALCLLSPTLVAAPEWRRRAPARTGLSAFLSHGRHDPLLPFALTERLRALLADAGISVRWSPFDGGHEIPPGVVADLSAFLAEVLGPGGGP